MEENQSKKFHPPEGYAVPRPQEVAMKEIVEAIAALLNSRIGGGVCDHPADVVAALGMLLTHTIASSVVYGIIRENTLEKVVQTMQLAYPVKLEEAKLEKVRLDALHGGAPAVLVVKDEVSK